MKALGLPAIVVALLLGLTLFLVALRPVQRSTGPTPPAAEGEAVPGVPPAIRNDVSGTTAPGDHRAVPDAAAAEKELTRQEEFTQGRILGDKWLKALEAGTPGPEEDALLQRALGALGPKSVVEQVAAIYFFSWARNPLRRRFRDEKDWGRWRGTPLDPADVRSRLSALIEDPRHRHMALYVMTRWDPGDAEMPLFYECLDDPDPATVGRAVDAIAGAEDKNLSAASVDRISRVVEHGSPKKVQACLERLQGVEFGEIILDRILAVAQSDLADGKTRLAAVECLGAREPKCFRTLTVLLAVLPTGSEEIRQAVLSSLWFGVPRERAGAVADRLARAVDEETVSFEAAVELIGVHGGHRHIAWLERWVEEHPTHPEHGRMKECAGYAIEEIRKRHPESVAGGKAD